MAVTPLKMLLIARDISQTRIANRANVSRAYINRVVHGRQKCSERVAKVFEEVVGSEVRSFLR